jgi:spoIIIJ-associated protein
LIEEEYNVESLEVTARTVNEAIEKALARLGKSRDEVDISVLSEGSRGILGIGSEEARILVSVREPEVIPPASTKAMVNLDAATEIARNVLENLLAGMRVSAEVAVKPPPPEAVEEGFSVSLDIEGADDVGILIGRRGETLSAIQFITTLITSKKVGKWTKVLVDVEGYRSRREISLRSLATRIASRVQETRQPMALEAMPPNERRVIHLALQNHPAVTTASTGEGDQRRVIISPKR